MKLTPKEKAWRDQFAGDVMKTFIGEISRQIAQTMVNPADAEAHFAVAAMLAYAAADAILAAKKRKHP